MVINLILVVGLYAFAGVSGVFSFGHAAFMAIGAYTAAILVIPPETKPFVLPELPGFLGELHLEPLPATLVVGGIAAALVAARPLHPALASVGADRGAGDVRGARIVNVVAQELAAGDARNRRGAGIPTATTLGCLAWAAGRDRGGVGCSSARGSACACGLRARTSRARARSGSGSAGERTIAFVLSAFLAGVAGALFGMFIGSFNPDAFFLNITFLMVAMLVIGGTTSLTGAVVGMIAISAVGGDPAPGRGRHRPRGGQFRRTRGCARSVSRS